MAGSLCLDYDDREGRGLFSQVINRELLKPGNHINVKRSDGLHWHHGIYTGNREREVIHFTGTLSIEKNLCISVTTLDEFLNGGTLQLVEYEEDSKWVRDRNSFIMGSKSASEVIATAEELAENWRDYNLFSNCEDFAVACKTRKIPLLEGKRSM